MPKSQLLEKDPSFTQYNASIALEKIFPTDQGVKMPLLLSFCGKFSHDEDEAILSKILQNGSRELQQEAK